MNIKVVNAKYDKKGNITSFDLIDNESGEIILPKYSDYTNEEDYIKGNVIGVEPMTAKEYLNEEQLEEMLSSSNYIAEEKLDGTRATLHINEDGCRIFSRRISKHTNWYVENTDSVPHLREIHAPNLAGTIIDGEMRIDGKDFKEVSSTLNSVWDKAIYKQVEWGFITLHSFDIIYYKGIYIAKMPLWKRKQYLAKVIKELNSNYVKFEPYTSDNIIKTIDLDFIDKYY